MEPRIGVGRSRLLRMAFGIALVSAATAPAPPAAGAPLRLSDAGFRISSSAVGDAAGFAVVTSDLDGDGNDDLVVGAPCDASTAAGAGAAHIFYGPIAPGRTLASADATVRGARAGDFVGETLAVLDMNGDDRAELVVGAPGPFLGTGPIADGCFELGPVQPGLNRPGEAYVYIGGERMAGVHDAAGSADSVITGLLPLDFASLGMGDAGDLDGDGNEELVVGAGGPGAGPGMAFLFGGGDLPERVHAGEADAVLVGEQPVDAFGYRIAGGDLDGDGADDLVISAPGVHPLRTSTTYVFRGGGVPAGVIHGSAADIRILGAPGDRAGHGGLLVADLDGDGADDLAIGARLAGVTHVFYGPFAAVGDVPLTAADARVSAGPGTDAGWALAALRLEDLTVSLVIGADTDAAAGSAAGAIHVVAGALSGDVAVATAGTTFAGAPGENAGFAVAVGDITGDGLDDIVAAAPALGGGVPGGVYIVPAQ